MGSLLFFLYINDLPVCINFSKVMLYADDTIIYNAAKTGAELEMILSLDLNNVAMWMTQNELFLNTKKTEYVIYGTRQNKNIQDEVIISYDGTPLTRSTTFKYLGIYIDQSLGFNDHIKYIIKKTSKRLGLLRRIRGSLTIDIANHLYMIMILPNIEYCDVHGKDAVC